MRDEGGEHRPGKEGYLRSQCRTMVLGHWSQATRLGSGAMTIPATSALRLRLPSEFSRLRTRALIACSISSRDPSLRFCTTSVATSWDTSSAFDFVAANSGLVFTSIDWVFGLVGEGLGECDVLRIVPLRCTSRLWPRLPGLRLGCKSVCP